MSSRLRRARADEPHQENRPAKPPGAGGETAEAFRSGDALCTFGRDLRVRSWNRAAEELTGITEEEALGQPCWQVLGGLDARGALVCHPGCSNARLAVEGRAVSTQELLIRTRAGRRWTTVSTIVSRHDDAPLVLHLLRPRQQPSEDHRAPADALRPHLTPRQQEVLELLGDGEQAKLIARHLGIVEATARNHIRAILRKLDSHSQIEAVARARRLGLLPR